nr:replication protein A 70 kDa DNA-binding subunit C isoform X1 [Arachis hypogaea]XP_029151875.1 replication protein A 70 kDa DNA-binding subunit C isoform X1 [Arachis hypogaea]XP_029151876.1 replication protein A 70 kDa DNA-binding subunit C isoform X1 [Arachis hypogaea]
MISCLYAIEWRCMWTQISFSLHFHPQLELKKCGKIQATVKKPLLNRFRDLIVEGQVYRMAYFTVVSNHGSYRATSHEFKLVFLHRTTVVAVDEDVIPKTCFNMFPFSDLLNMTEDYDFLVDIIGLLTSVGEEKKYAKEGKIVKMIVLELTSKDLTLRCALFGDYVNQVNHFLASGYVEQPVVVIQLAKVKFFRGQVGLQNVMYATQMLFNPDLPEVVDFRHSMIEQGVNGTQPLFIANEGKVVSLEDDFMRLTRKCTIEELQDKNQEGSFIIFGTIQGIVEDGGWWYSACVCGKGIYPQNGVYYCDFSLKHITNVTPRFKVKITVEDHSGEGIFLLFDREASYLLKKSCADLFSEVQRDASLVCGDTYPPIFQGLIGKKLLLKVDTKGVPHDTFYGTFRVRRICDDPTIITIFELPNYDADDEFTPKKEPDLHKSVLFGKGDTGIKEESSKTCIKSEKVDGECCGILCKSPVLIDFLAEKHSAVSGGSEFSALVNGEDGKDEKTPTNDTVSDDLSTELNILLSSPEKETQDVLSHVLHARCQYGEKVAHDNDVVTSKGKRNLNPQFEEAATLADERGSKVAKVNGV